MKDYKAVLRYAQSGTAFWSLPAKGRRIVQWFKKRHSIEPHRPVHCTLRPLRQWQFAIAVNKTYALTVISLPSSRKWNLGDLKRLLWPVTVKMLRNMESQSFERSQHNRNQYLGFFAAFFAAFHLLGLVPATSGNLRTSRNQQGSSKIM